MGAVRFSSTDSEISASVVSVSESGAFGSSDLFASFEAQGSSSTGDAVDSNFDVNDKYAPQPRTVESGRNASPRTHSGRSSHGVQRSSPPNAGMVSGAASSSRRTPPRSGGGGGKHRGGPPPPGGMMMVPGFPANGMMMPGAPGGNVMGTPFPGGIGYGQGGPHMSYGLGAATRQGVPHGVGGPPKAGHTDPWVTRH